MRKLLGGLVISLAAIGLASCGGDDDTGTIEPVDSDGGATVEVTAQGGAFTPTSAEVAAGTVHFVVTNADGGQHTFTMDEAEVDLALEGGATEEADADLDPGEYEWRCTIHPSMTGTLTVT